MGAAASAAGAPAPAAAAAPGPVAVRVRNRLGDTQLFLDAGRSFHVLDPGDEEMLSVFRTQPDADDELASEAVIVVGYGPSARAPLRRVARDSPLWPVQHLQSPLQVLIAGFERDRALRELVACKGGTCAPARLVAAGMVRLPADGADSEGADAGQRVEIAWGADDAPPGALALEFRAPDPLREPGDRELVVPQELVAPLRRFKMRMRPYLEQVLGEDDIDRDCLNTARQAARDFDNLIDRERERVAYEECVRNKIPAMGARGVMALLASELIR